MSSNIEPKTSPAKLRANAKYDKSHYKSIACKCKLSDYEDFKQYASANNIDSMNALLYKAVRYCIDNNVKL